MRGRLAYDITQGLTTGVKISYDEAYETRVSADLSVRFGGPSTTAAKKKKRGEPIINALTTSPKNRDVRVHDLIKDSKKAPNNPLEELNLCYNKDICD